MSSAGMPVLAVPVILVAGAAVAVGAAAVLAIRAADATGVLAAEGLIRLDEALRRRSDEYWEARARSETWQCAAHAVVARNAEIEVLRAAVSRRGLDDGPDLGIPPFFDLAGKTLEQVHEWCGAVDGLLAKSQRAYDARVESDALAKLGEELQVPASSSVLQARATRLEQLAAEHRSAQRPTPKVDRRRAPTDAEVAALLALLGPDADVADRAAARAVAVLALEERSVERARGYFDQLAYLVQMARQAASKEDRLEAARCLEVIRVASSLPTFVRPESELTGALTAIASGARAWTAQLRGAASRVHRDATEAAQRAYLAELIDRLAVERGYQIVDEQSNRHGGTVRILSRADLPNHVVHMVIDGTEVRGGTLRRDENDHSELNEADSAACAAWIEDFDSIATGVRASRARVGEIHVVRPVELVTTTVEWAQPDERNEDEAQPKYRHHT